jgi:hypothetical protein
VSLAALALPFTLAAGCQSNSDRDLIARDRRMQEDQIYALQDYINQYQRLLCQYRSENATLKRQLCENYSTVEPQSVEPQPASLPRSAGPPPKNSPQFHTPAPPGVKQQQSPTTPTPPEIAPPDVPPLKSTTDNASARSSDQAATDGRQTDSAPQVLQTSYDTSDPPRQSRADNRPPDVSPAVPSDTVSELMISGEVVANASGGPRLMVDVVPFDSNGQVQPFEGSASIMLLAIDEDGKQHNRGRWNYSPDDVREALNTATGKPKMRYFIELPQGTQTSGAVQLWVRLVRQSGEKLLTHATIDLTKPGIFSSRLEKSEPPSVDVAAAAYTEETAAPSTEMTTSNIESPWVVAQPGKPANLPPETSDESGAGGWRASSEPMPAIVATSTKAVPTATISKSVHHAQHEPAAVAEVPAKRPAWSSDRSGDSTQKDVTRPSWSATR